MFYRFPAMRGIQANSEYFVCMIPLGVLSKIFIEGSSDVLPELGERNVLNTTFNDLLEQYLKKFGKLEKFSNFLERVYDNNIKSDYIE